VSFGIFTAGIISGGTVVAIGIAILISFVFIFTALPAINVATLRLVSPYFRSVGHRDALFMSAWALTDGEHSNTHQRTHTWQSFLWLLPNYHDAGVEVQTNPYVSNPFGAMRTRLTPPFDTVLLPKYDGRYFWLGEWLMYPWQFVPNDHMDVGGTAYRVFEPLAPGYRALLYRLQMYRGFGIPRSLISLPINIHVYSPVYDLLRNSRSAMTVPFNWANPSFEILLNTFLPKSRFLGNPHAMIQHGFLDFYSFAAKNYYGQDYDDFEAITMYREYGLGY